MVTSRSWLAKLQAGFLAYKKFAADKRRYLFAELTSAYICVHLRLFLLSHRAADFVANLGTYLVCLFCTPGLITFGKCGWARKLLLANGLRDVGEA